MGPSKKLSANIVNFHIFTLKTATLFSIKQNQNYFRNSNATCSQQVNKVNNNNKRVRTQKRTRNSELADLWYVCIIWQSKFTLNLFLFLGGSHRNGYFRIRG